MNKKDPLLESFVGDCMVRRMRRIDIVREAEAKFDCSARRVYRAIERFYEDRPESKERRRLHLLKSLDQAWNYAVEDKKYGAIAAIANQIAKIEGFHTPEQTVVHSQAQLPMPQEMYALLKELEDS